MNTVVSLLDLYSQCLTKIIPVACVTVSQQLLVRSVRFCPTDEGGILSSLCSHHHQRHEQLWGASSTDTSGHRCSCTHNADIGTLRRVCEYMFICHTLRKLQCTYVCVDAIYMYPLTSL